MSEQTSAIVSKVWGMCNPLRDDGVSYGDYLEQLTYLIFLKMSEAKRHDRPSFLICGFPRQPILNNRNIWSLSGTKLSMSIRFS